MPLLKELCPLLILIKVEGKWENAEGKSDGVDNSLARSLSHHQALPYFEFACLKSRISSAPPYRFDWV
jgi:hypothetical protein